MLCPLCSHQTKVLESRGSHLNPSIRRRRQCLICNFRFSTREEIEILDLTVIKRNGTQEAYSQEKLTDGIKKSLHKRGLPSEKFKKLISDIERDIHIKAKNNAISAEIIGEIVMKYLKECDTVAYVRFASVYRDFKDPEDFAREIKKLSDTPPPIPS